MIRLEREDFENAERLEKLARAAGSKGKPLSADGFKQKFGTVVNELRGGL
jgi:hypothetical protein